MWQKLGDLFADRRNLSPHRAQFDGARAIADAGAALHKLVPEVYASQTHPTKLVDGVLTIEVVHPAIAQVLRQKEQEILRVLREKRHQVRRLVFAIRRGETGSQA